MAEHIDDNIDEKLEGEYGVDTNENNSDSQDNLYPISEIRIERAQYSVTHLYNLIKKRQQLIIAPDFQRKNVWKPKQKCELIESIIMGIPIPIMYLFESKDGKRQVVDGKQRITTIIDFMDNAFPLKDLKILTGKLYQNRRYEDLDSKTQGLLEDYQLFFYIIQPPTSERIKYDIFDRVNRGGTQLNNQEMRNALYQGKSTKLLKELSESQAFKTATESGIKTIRMRDQYVILRLLSFFMLKNDWFKQATITYKSDLEDFLAKSMTYINEKMSENDILRLKNLFLKAMIDISINVGKDAFRFSGESGQRRPINMLLFEALGYIFMSREIYGWDLSRVNFSQLKESFDRSNLFNGKNDSEKRINERYRLITSSI